VSARAVAAGAIKVLALGIAVALLAAILVAGCGLGPAARHALNFGFDGVPHTATEVARIATRNTALTVGTLAAAALAPHVTPPAHRLLTLVLATVLVINAAAVGVALGAYGRRGLLALAPHAPLEFVALSIAGGAYMQTRKQAVRGSLLLHVGVVSVLLLVAAATFETYISSTGSAR
jgi:hypothetical protein